MSPFVLLKGMINMIIMLSTMMAMTIIVMMMAIPIVVVIVSLMMSFERIVMMVIKAIAIPQEARITEIAGITAPFQRVVIGFRLPQMLFHILQGLFIFLWKPSLIFLILFTVGKKC
jgi:hypothetical protein